MTIETTYSQAREQFKTLMDRAVDDREVVVVRRPPGAAADHKHVTVIDSTVQTRLDLHTS